MFKYAKVQTDVFLQLVNESNPNLVEERDLINSTLGVPVARTPGAGEIQDTTISMYATPESFYIGKRTLTYRRIDLTKFFANTIVELDLWTSNGVLSGAQFIQEVNKKYGLALTTDDIPGGNRSNSTSVQNMFINTGSLLYKGYISFRWLMGKRPLSEILGSVKPAGLKWDAAYVEGKPIATLMTFGPDFTNQLDTINKLATTTTLTTTLNPFVKQLIDKLNAYTGLSLDSTKDHTLQGGLAGLVLTKVTLPSDNAIEAYAEKYNRVLTISALPGSWFCGKFLLHYNA